MNIKSVKDFICNLPKKCCKKCSASKDGNCSCCEKCRFVCGKLSTVVVSAIVALIVCKATAERNVKKVIDEDPKFIIESLQKMEMNERKKQQAEATKRAPEIASKIAERNYGVIGNKNGSKVIIEFFDYSCGHCKKMADELIKLSRTESDVKIIPTDLPILSENSFFAASLGVYIQQKNPEKFESYYTLLQKTGIDNQSLKRALSTLGLPANYLEKAKQDKQVREILETNFAYARELGVRGTPALLVNGKFIGGAVSAEDLKAMLR